jgi:hypothetical protein
VCWVLPRLWQQAIVPVDVVGVEAQLALLGVLLDGRAGLILCVCVGGGGAGVSSARVYGIYWSHGVGVKGSAKQLALLCVLLDGRAGLVL